MAEKVTFMILKVDLQCPCCYKKVKKILCKFPQIRDQVYDEQKNVVRITVVCCSPEKIRDKLCCKGGKVIHSIEIVELPKAKPPPEKPADKPKPNPPEKSKDPPPVVVPEKPLKPAEKQPKPPEKPKESEKPKPAPEKTKDPPPKQPQPAPAPKPPAPEPVVPEIPCPLPVVPVMPTVPTPCPVPVGFCYHPCYCGGGLCYCRPVPPPPPPGPPCYDNYWGYGYGKGCYVSRCDYFSEENTSSCSIM